MTVVALVGDSADAKPVVTWAGRFAAVQKTELIVFYVPSGSDGAEFVLESADEEQSQDETYAAVCGAIEAVVRTRRARKGRVPRHAVSIRRVADSDPAAGTLSRLRIESPSLFIGAAFGMQSKANGKSIAQKVAAKAACDAIVLVGNGPSKLKTKHIAVATSDGTHDQSAIDLAARAAGTVVDTTTVVCIEASVGEKAIEVGERHLRSLLRELGHVESSHLQVKAVIAEDWSGAVAEEAVECDLLLVGADMEKKVADLLERTPGATAGLFYRAPRLGFGRDKEHAAWLLPQVNPTDYADLYEMLQAGSRWNSDFIVMLSLAAAIATLGLLQSSPAVVIGSMLLAPLMTPMIGLGLALNQGNAKLASASSRSIAKGFFAALAISMILGWVTPGSDLTPEVLARTEPNILDLLIALFSGAAAAYALARPSVAGTIAGVAIATALVPPLCSSGVSLAYGQYLESLGALFLLVANVLAITLAAAAMFRLMGLRELAGTAHRRVWVRYVVAGLGACALMVAVPLVTVFLRQVREGKDTPYALALTNETRDVLLEHIDNMPDVNVLFAGRAGVHRESKPTDIGIILSSKRPLPRSEAEELVELIRDAMQNPSLQVKVGCVVDGWADDSSDDSAGESAEEGPDQQPSGNEKSGT